MKKIAITLDPQSIANGIKEIKKYQQELKDKTLIFAERLSDFGLTVVRAELSGHIDSGQTINSLRVENLGNGKFAVVAQSKSILFFEFGTGVKGGGHPKAAELGMGPGTYHGAGHWDDPNGWWYMNDNGEWRHSYGYQPYMPMYKTSLAMIENIERIAKEVFV